MFRVFVDSSEVDTYFRIVKIKLDTFYPVFLKQREYLMTAFVSNAMTGGAYPGSGGWRPEKPGPWSAAQGMPAYLYRTGYLMESLAALRGQTADINPSEATFGIDNVPYAKFHQYGTEDMPARRLIFVPSRYSVKFAKDVRDHAIPRYHSTRSGGFGRIGF